MSVVYWLRENRKRKPPEVFIINLIKDSFHD